ncbi:hypothetical protein ACVII1_007493 [Bradyrhizobium elkanii]
MMIVARLLARHHAPRKFGGEEVGALQIRADHGVPIRLGLLGRQFLDRYAGIVDQDRDRTERGFGGVERFRNAGDIRDVHLHRSGAAALGLDLLLEAFQLRGLARGQHHRGAMRRQHAGELPPESLRGAGDEDDFFTDIE